MCMGARKNTKNACARARARAQHTHAHTHTHTHTHTHKHKHTQTHTHAHTHALSPTRPRPPPKVVLLLDRRRRRPLGARRAPRGGGRRRRHRGQVGHRQQARHARILRARLLVRAPGRAGGRAPPPPGGGRRAAARQGARAGGRAPGRSGGRRAPRGGRAGPAKPVAGPRRARRAAPSADAQAPAAEDLLAAARAAHRGPCRAPQGAPARGDRGAVPAAPLQRVLVVRRRRMLRAGRPHPHARGLLAQMDRGAGEPRGERAAALRGRLGHALGRRPPGEAGPRLSVRAMARRAGRPASGASPRGPGVRLLPSPTDPSTRGSLPACNTPAPPNPRARTHTPTRPGSSTCGGAFPQTTGPATPPRRRACSGWPACCCRRGWPTPTGRGGRGGFGDSRGRSDRAAQRRARARVPWLRPSPPGCVFLRLQPRVSGAWRPHLTRLGFWLFDLAACRLFV
jgi:hypothetical protein